jgi:hypothetical protein
MNGARPERPALRFWQHVLRAEQLAGAYLTRDSRRAIVEQNEYLERVAQAQEERIIELEDQLAQRPTLESARTRAKPAIR